MNPDTFPDLPTHLKTYIWTTKHQEYPKTNSEKVAKTDTNGFVAIVKP